MIAMTTSSSTSVKPGRTAVAASLRDACVFDAIASFGETRPPGSRDRRGQDRIVGRSMTKTLDKEATDCGDALRRANFAECLLPPVFILGTPCCATTRKVRTRFVGSRTHF